MKTSEKLKTLANDYGFDDPFEMLAEFAFDSIAPAICMNKDCDYTTDMEPDQTRGWCEECGTQSVKSAMVLAGVI